MSGETTTSKDMLRVSTCDGKYTVVQDATGRQSALRYGEPWRDLVGDGLTLALAHDLDEARAALTALYALVEDGTLVRDISGDHNSVRYVWQGLRIVTVLKQVQDALGEAAAPTTKEPTT